ARLGLQGAPEEGEALPAVAQLEQDEAEVEVRVAVGERPDRRLLDRLLRERQGARVLLRRDQGIRDVVQRPAVLAAQEQSAELEARLRGRRRDGDGGPATAEGKRTHTERDGRSER